MHSPFKRILAIIISVGLLYVVAPSFFKSVQRVAFNVFTYPFRVTRSIGDFFASKKALMSENKNLHAEIIRLSGEMLKVESIILENGRLRALAGLKSSNTRKSIAGEVLGRVPSSSGDVLILDKGERDGVKKFMAVCSENGMVGVVSESYPYSSKITLITDADLKVGVILEKSRQMGVLSGYSTNQCKILYLETDSDVRKGERVFTSGASGLYPQNLFVGIVEKTQNDPTGIFKEAYVKPAQDMNTVEEVLCIE